MSGGHINPAVSCVPSIDCTASRPLVTALTRPTSFALMITKRVTVIRAFAYICAQCCGAILGTLIAASLRHDAYSAAGGGVNGSDTYGVREIITAEVMATALLMFTVYAAIDPERAGKVIHIGALGPIAIGGAVFAAHLALLPIDGASINPARSLGAAVVHREWRQHWAFWVGPMVGASASASFYELCLKGRPHKAGSKKA